MKKKLVIKFAVMMGAIINIVGATTLAAPTNSFLLWGEPTPPIQKEDK